MIFQGLNGTSLAVKSGLKDLVCVVQLGVGCFTFPFL